jgi:hypothetical protein
MLQEIHNVVSTKRPQKYPVSNCNTFSGILTALYRILSQIN